MGFSKATSGLLPSHWQGKTLPSQPGSNPLTRQHPFYTKVVGRASFSGVWILVFLDEAITALANKGTAQAARKRDGTDCTFISRDGD